MSDYPFDMTVKERVSYFCWNQWRELKYKTCLVVDHKWRTYESHGWKTGRDGIDRPHIWINFRCARCGMEESTYSQYPVTRTFPDWLRGTWYELKKRALRRRSNK